MFKIAFRNVIRNGRRSLMTGMAVAVGATALILLGEYNATVKLGIETGVAQNSGHISVFQKGYSDYGSGRPADYSISSYKAVIADIKNDAVLKPMLNVVTPRVSLGGIAGNAVLDKSKTFFGSGVIPSDQDKMFAWDEHNLRGGGKPGTSGLKDGVVDHGIIGRGLARILGLCKPLKIKNCPVQPGTAGDTVVVHGAKTSAPRLELLSGSSGMPNVVVFYVDDARAMGAKELDDAFVSMHLNLAQQLLFGGGEKKVSAIAIQLIKTEDIPAAKSRLNALIAERKLPLEVRDFREINPQFMQVIAYFEAMFAFLGLVLGIIVLFTVANTMGMSVMERTNEIGTARAMGVRRSGIHRLFLVEGCILGVLGATGGILLAWVFTVVINGAGITWTPPSNANPVPLYLMEHGNEALLTGVWIVLVIISTIASMIPANRAAKMKVVDALRHV